jgi:hypothetical protein
MISQQDLSSQQHTTMQLHAVAAHRQVLAPCMQQILTTAVLLAVGSRTAVVMTAAAIAMVAAMYHSISLLHRCMLLSRRETDESVSEPQFINLSYVQAQHDYLAGNYPVVREDAAQVRLQQQVAAHGWFF